ncbi:YihY/virulence factor BrkB family protein [Lactococcus nasutitermitis]|uniref:YihY/virulence factor BrkB family protein n=1 Tax=Lactococcus nasutitermitis TaxID=1652957 RepID=A0ABV9J9W5_9LACT|nr:YihY/virulence factor BrkB family protein [Lactococcus nasutitermitis]
MKKLLKILGDLFSTFLSFFKSSEMSLSSIAVAYYLLLSLFPVLLIVGNALPFFHINVTTILHFLNENFPEQLYDGLAPVIRNILSNPNTSLLWISIIAGLWTFSRALSSLQMAMNKAYEVNKHRDFIVSRVIGLISGLAIFLFLYFSIALSTFGQVILEHVHRIFDFNDGLYRTLHSMTLPAVGLATFLSLMLLYFILPNVRIRKLRYTMPGTIFSTFVLVFLTNLVAKYVNFALNQLHDLKLIGSLVIFALMIWFIFIARVLIIGAILNATYQRIRVGQFETRRGELVEFIKDIRKQD